MQIDWSNEWNRRMLAVLNRTSLTEIGLIAARDTEAALIYEDRLLVAKSEVEKRKAICSEQMA